MHIKLIISLVLLNVWSNSAHSKSENNSFLKAKYELLKTEYENKSKILTSENSYAGVYLGDCVHLATDHKDPTNFYYHNVELGDKTLSQYFLYIQPDGQLVGAQFGPSHTANCNQLSDSKCLRRQREAVSKIFNNTNWLKTSNSSYRNVNGDFYSFTNNNYMKVHARSFADNTIRTKLEYSFLDQTDKLNPTNNSHIAYCGWYKKLVDCHELPVSLRPISCN